MRQYAAQRGLLPYGQYLLYGYAARPAAVRRRIVFSDVRFREATTFRRVRPGEYGFYLAATNASPYFPFAPDVDIETVEDLPIPVGDNYIPDYGDLMPLASFYEAFRQGILYTAYVLGLGTPDYPYFVTTLETR